MLKVKLELKKLARRKELIVIVWTGIDGGFSGGSGSEWKLTLGTLRVSSGRFF